MYKWLRTNVVQLVLCTGVSIVILAIYHAQWGYAAFDEARWAYTAQAVADHEVNLSGKYGARLKSAETTSFMFAAETALASVVAIRAMEDPHLNTSGESVRNGSGVIVSSDGFIVTNLHVSGKSGRIEVVLPDRRVYLASVVGIDALTDIALLKIEAEGLPSLLIGNSDSLRIGEWVLAVGHPFRQQATVTAGIVSAKARQIQLLDREGVESFIQTDAAMNPGNSGGALVNSAGEFVGLCTAVMSGSGTYQGFSFAIPSKLVQKVVGDLREYGSVQHAWIGAEVETVDSEIARTAGLPSIQGVKISSVHQDGASAKSGLLTGDIVLSSGTQIFGSAADLRSFIALHRPGDEIQVDIYRNKKQFTRKITLLNQFNSTERLSVIRTGILATLGIEIRDSDSREKETIPGAGLVIISVLQPSIAYQVKIQPGYVATRCNGAPIYSARQFNDYLTAHKGEKISIEGYYPGLPGRYPYEFTIPE